METLRVFEGEHKVRGRKISYQIDYLIVIDINS